ncbi:unnamed protein product, partial [Symbiodinium sp. CCMP2456]
DILDFSVGECSICLRQTKRSQCLRELPCGHVFHEQCIRRWWCSLDSQVSISCPLCRQEFDPEMVNDVSQLHYPAVRDDDQEDVWEASKDEANHDALDSGLKE